MDKLSSVNLPPLSQAPTFAPKSRSESGAESDQPVHATDSVDAERRRQVVNAAQAKPAVLDAVQREKLVENEAKQASARIT